MSAGGDPAALGQLLRTRRERLGPADVGLPAGRRRRTAGRRREEVALLASLSATYCTFLEQGRPVRPSAQVLDALASARDSEHIRDWWPRHDVTAIGGSGSKKLRHPRLGPAEYSHVVLQIADHPDQTLVTYSPAAPPEPGREEHEFPPS
jgi:hypothetical protein